jgi:hypothetical protein
MRGTRTSRARGAGTATRLRTALEVLLAALLAGTVALLATWLAERPDARILLDWTAGRSNTLSEATKSALAKLQEDVAVDVFFTPGEAGRVVAQAQERTLRLLARLRDDSGGRVSFREHDLARQAGVDAALARLQELGLREVVPGGIVVLTQGKRHALLQVNGDLADIDPGDPRGRSGPPRPARLVAFRGEAAIAGALLRVSLEESLTVLFSVGHGEPPLDSTGSTGIGGLSQLRSALQGAGFRVDRWSPKETPRVPDACAVLAIVGPEQPFTDEESEAIAEFVESGGRLVCAPGLSGPGLSANDRGLPALVSRWGIRIETEGIVAEPRATTSGPLYGSPQCPDVIVGSDGLAPLSPVTESLKRSERYVEMPGSLSLVRTTGPPGASVITLLTTDDAAWRDQPDATAGGHDWKPSPGESRGPFALAMTSVFRPPRTSSARKVASGSALPESRVLCIGAAAAFANASAEVNRDFLLNGFDWAASREFLVHVDPESRPARRIDLASGRALSNVFWVCVVLLPTTCLLLGLFTNWRRLRR